MSESKHTPGPWNFDDDNAIMAEVGAHICTVNMADDFPCIDDDEGDERANVDIECKANAHLIAAAPELLEALKEALSWEPKDDSCAPWVPDARAAIAKAEGGAA